MIVARLSPYFDRCVVCRRVGYSLNTTHKRGRLIVIQRLTKEDVGERGAEKLFVRGSVSDSAPCLRDAQSNMKSGHNLTMRLPDF